MVQFMLNEQRQESEEEAEDSKEHEKTAACTAQKYYQDESKRPVLQENGFGEAAQNAADELRNRHDRIKQTQLQNREDMSKYEEEKKTPTLLISDRSDLTEDQTYVTGLGDNSAITVLENPYQSINEQYKKITPRPSAAI